MAETNEPPLAETGKDPVVQTGKASAAKSRKASVAETRKASVVETVEDSAPPVAEEIQAGPSPQAVARIAEESAGEPTVDPVAVIVEAAVEDDFEILEEIGGEGIKAVESAASSFSGSFQEFAAETTDYTKKCFESRTAFIEDLLGAKTLQSAFQIQAGYTKSAGARFLTHLVKINDIYCNLLKKVSEPAKIAKAEVEKV